MGYPFNMGCHVCWRIVANCQRGVGRLLCISFLRVIGLFQEINSKIEEHLESPLGWRLHNSNDACTTAHEPHVLRYFPIRLRWRP